MNTHRTTVMPGHARGARSTRSAGREFRALGWLCPTPAVPARPCHAAIVVGWGVAWGWHTHRHHRRLWSGARWCSAGGDPIRPRSTAGPPPGCARHVAALDGVSGWAVAGADGRLRPVPRTPPNRATRHVPRPAAGSGRPTRSIDTPAMFGWPAGRICTSGPKRLDGPRRVPCSPTGSRSPRHRPAVLAVVIERRDALRPRSSTATGDPGRHLRRGRPDRPRRSATTNTASPLDPRRAAANRCWG